jgi:hypothetical protein
VATERELVAKVRNEGVEDAGERIGEVGGEISVVVVVVLEAEEERISEMVMSKSALKNPSFSSLSLSN